MPDASKAQRRLMEAVRHSPTFAAKVGIPKKVADDFDAADKKAGVTYGSLPERVGPQRTAGAGRKARVTKAP